MTMDKHFDLGGHEPPNLRDAVREHIRQHGVHNLHLVDTFHYGQFVNIALSIDGYAENLAQVAADMDQETAEKLERYCVMAWDIHSRSLAATTIGELVLRALERRVRPWIEEAFEREREAEAEARHDAAVVL